MDVGQQKLIPTTRAELETKIHQIEQEMMAAGRAWNFALAEEKQKELDGHIKLRKQLLIVSELQSELETMRERVENCIEARRWKEAQSIKEAVTLLEHRLSVETSDGNVEAESVDSPSPRMERERDSSEMSQSLTSKKYDDVGTRHDFLAVFQAEPLVWVDTQDNSIHPFHEPPDFLKERNTILEALKDADKIGAKIDVDFQIATTNRLAACLAAGESRVLHVSCHGHQKYLAIENGWGALQTLTFPEVKEFIAAGSGHLKLVFVSSCFSHNAGKAFVDAGVPHVVCCKQDANLDAAAIEFARHFYRALACGRTLRVAFQMAQAALTVAPCDSQKFLLLPKKPDFDTYHDVPVFYTEILPDTRSRRSTSLSSSRILPPPPKTFLGRQIVMYEVLRDVRYSRFIQITGPRGIGKSSLGQAVCKYIVDRKDEFFFEEVFWFPALGNSSNDDDLSLGFHQVLTSVVTDGISEPFDASSYNECCGKIVSLLYESRCLVFLDAREMGSESAMMKLQTFVEMLIRGTMHVSVILICQSGKYVSTKRISDNKRVDLAPLDMHSSVVLFATRCSFVNQDLAKLLVPASQKDATLINKSMSKRCSDIFSIIGEGYPARILTAAENMSSEEYDNLIRIGERKEFQTKINTRVALDEEISRLSNELKFVEDRCDFLRAQEIKDTLDELEILGESLPSLAKLRVKEAKLCAAVDEFASSREFSKAAKLQNEVGALRLRILREEEVMFKATKPKSTKQRSLIHVEKYQIRPDIDGDRAYHLHVSHGSITDYSHEDGPSAIVYQTNESCIPIPGGVASAVVQAGGVQLREDIAELPSIEKNSLGDVKCRTGEARMIGPQSYGDLHAPYVILTVGPTYADIDELDSDLLEHAKKDALLRSSYESSLELARKARLSSVAFCLVSAGNRGGAHFERALLVALEAVCAFEGYPELQEIHLCAFEQYQCDALTKLCGDLGIGTAPAKQCVAVASQRMSELAPTNTPRKLFGWLPVGRKNPGDQHSVRGASFESNIGTYHITSQHSGGGSFDLIAARGSIIDFSYRNRHAAIVCPTNEGCTPVKESADGAVCQAGGSEFSKKVSKLPTLENNAWGGVRCRPGDARIIGPATKFYGKLRVPYVILTVGPTYTLGDDTQSKEEKDELLRSAYQSCLDLAKEACLEAVAFALISAGHRAAGDVARVLRITVETIAQYKGYKELREIHLLPFKKQEADTLKTILCDTGLPQRQSSDNAPTAVSSGIPTGTG